jgi:hypothetical protein
MPGHSLAILQSVDNGGTEFSLSHSYRSGAYASGAWKLAQNFAAELLTQRGSVRFDPAYGSRFPNELRGYNVLSIDELRGSLARGINDVVTNMQGRERMSDRADEMLASADIVQLQQQLDRVIVSIRLTTEAGRTVVIPLPIELLNHNDA